MSDKWINKIQGLLDKAERTEYGPEREALQEKADELMLKYSVEQYQLEQAARSRGEAASMKPVTEDILIPYKTQNGWGQSVYDLLSYIAYAVGVKQVYRKIDKTPEGEWGLAWRVTLVGFESDIAYVKMLFMSLRLALLKSLEPEPSPGASYDANVFALHEAGIKWEEICRLMNKASEVGCWDRTPWPDGGRLKRAHKRECARLGVPYVATYSSSTYQRSFADGFTNRIFTRLMGKRRESSVSLVLHQKAEEVQSLYDQLVPPIEVVEVTEEKPRKRVAKAKEIPFNWAASARGADVADRADLSSMGERVDRTSRAEVE